MTVEPLDAPGIQVLLGRVFLEAHEFAPFGHLWLEEFCKLPDVRTEITEAIKPLGKYTTSVLSLFQYSFGVNIFENLASGLMSSILIASGCSLLRAHHKVAISTALALRTAAFILGTPVDLLSGQDVKMPLLRALLRSKRSLSQSLANSPPMVAKRGKALSTKSS